MRHIERLTSYLSEQDSRRDHVRIVLNRFDARQPIGSSEVEKTLKLWVAWKIPNDYSAVRDAANTGSLASINGSPVGRVVRQMAVAAYGKPKAATTKKGWKLFG